MKKKTKAMNEEKKGDHEYEMIRRQTDNIMVNAKKLKKKVGKGEGEAKAWVQSKITKAADYLDTAADYMTDKDSVKEGTLRSWFKGSKSKDGKGGWVNVKTGGTCASDEPGEGVPKCVSRAKYDSMSKKERESAHRRKRAADPNQQSKTGAAKPTYVSTDKPKKKKKKTMKDETEFTSLPLVLEVPQNDGEFKLGLMFRESLEQDRGMLFIFESDDYWTFHMKNTFIPLDIAFIKEDGTIDSIKELEPMSPIPVYPDSEVRYAVEVNHGWFAENGVEVGDALLEDIQEHHKKDADGNTIPHEDEEELNEKVKDKKGKGSGTKDACYYKVKSRYSVWPSAYASGALVKCRKVGAANWGNKSEEFEVTGDNLTERGMGLHARQIQKDKLKNSNKPSRNITRAGMRSGTVEKVNEMAVQGKTATYTKDFKTGEITKGTREQRIRGAKKTGTPPTKMEHYSWRDSFDLDEMTIAQRNSMQNQNKMSGKERAQAMAKARIAAKQAGTAGPQLSGRERAQAMAKQRIAAKAAPTQAAGGAAATRPAAQAPAQQAGQAAAGKPQYQQNRDRLRASRQQQQRPAGGGLIGRLGKAVGSAVSGAKRVAGGVADAATGNRFDFDKRGGQRPAPQAAGGGATRPMRGSGARNRPMQAGGQAAGGAVGQAASGGAATRPAAQQAAGGGATASRKIDGGALANTMRAQNNQSGGGVRRPMSPMMQKRVAQMNTGKNAAIAVNKLKPQAGQTVTTRPNAGGGTTATLTGGTGSVSGNVNKAKRIVRNQNVGPTTVGKITGGQGVSDF